MEERTTKKENKADNQALLLGKYDVGRLLCHDTFAKLYHTKAVKTGDSVAIKVLEKEKILKSGLTTHIKHEISIFRRIRHADIVQISEVMATKSKIYVVMELVCGGELFNKVANGRLKEGVACKNF